MTVVDGYSILAGTANSALASAIAERLGSPLTPCRIDRFPDGEIAVQLLAPVRRKEVFLVQPTSPPVNDHLIELLEKGQIQMALLDNSELALIRCNIYTTLTHGAHNMLCRG